MTEILLDDEMKARIAKDFEISDDPDHSGRYKVHNKKLQMSMRWAFETIEAAQAYIASTLLQEDFEAEKAAREIDPRIQVMLDYEGDWVMHIEGPATFGTFAEREDVLPLAGELSRLIIDGTYYDDPSNPDFEE